MFKQIRKIGLADKQQAQQKISPDRGNQKRSRTAQENSRNTGQGS